MHWLRICVGSLLSPSDLEKTLSLETITAWAVLQGNGTQQALGPVLTKDGNESQKKQAVVSKDLRRDLQFSRRDPTCGHRPRTILSQSGASGEESKGGQSHGAG